jgi:hypothetical protein
MMASIDSKLAEIKLLREIKASVCRHPELLDSHPELTLIREIVNEVEQKILRSGSVMLAGGSGVSK